MSNFDAIVIGAGNGGLTAAAKLQRSGKKTLLLERHNIPGGCATSFVRGDFEFEVALHQLSGLGTEQQPFVLRNIFEELGVMERVQFVQGEHLYRLLTHDGVDVTLPADWLALRELLQAEFQDEADAIGSFLDLCERITIESFMNLPAASKSTEPEEFKRLCPTFVSYGLKTSQEVLDEFFSSEKLKAIFAAYWGYLGLPVNQLPFRDLGALLYAYATFKPHHVVGGSQALSNALLDTFLEAGGEVRFNCAASRILTTDGAVSGVRVVTGEDFTCDYVVSNASSIITYNELLDTDAPLAGVHDEFKSSRVGTSGFVIYLGLDCPPETIGVNTATNFFATSGDDNEVYEAAFSLDGPLGGVLTCYNFEDPSFAPAGKSHVALMCLQHGSAWDSVQPEDYARTKYEQAELLLDLTERFFPGLRDHIEEIEIATPRTMMRYLNTPQGAIYGFNQDMYEIPLFRQHEQAVPGLYLAGCWVGMGGFQPAYQAGDKAARQIIKDAKSNEAKEMSHA